MLVFRNVAKITTKGIKPFWHSDTARVAMSDDPNSWNIQLGWPIKDADGNNIFISDQDSYCVFNDSNNTVQILGLQLAQTGYAFGTNFAKDALYFKYELTNTSQNTYEGVYFSLQNDIDVGNISGGDPEYADDKIGFIKARNLVYFYDDGISSEWPDGKTGYFGIMILKTPEVNGTQLGISDMHYMLADDEAIADIDSLQYGFMSSSINLYNSPIGSKYFHPGSGGNIHFDDPATIPPSGLDLIANISSGPYTLAPGDTLVFYTAFIAGNTLDEMLNAATVAQNAVDVNFNLPKPPSRPKLFSSSGDFKAVLYWDDSAELSFDEFSGYDFEGYRLYRSKDRGIHWDKVAEYDLINSTGNNTGLQYTYVDTTVINGFEYWYSITAFDRGSTLVESLESPIGNSLDAVNTVSVTPRSNAIGRTSVSAIDVTNLNTGNTNYLFDASAIDNESLAGNEYKTNFTFVPRIEMGDPATDITIQITDSAATKPHKYALEFVSSGIFDLKNVTLNTTIRTGYPYPTGGRDLVITGDGLRISMRDSVSATPEMRPEQGDIITINYAMNVVRNQQDSVIKNRPYQLDQTQTTNDGISIKLVEPQIIKCFQNRGTDNVEMNFEVVDASLVQIKYISHPLRKWCYK
ncbi:MAG: hypothetical protein LC101_11445 [Flavobacteriales bacterium]|nr:hypothetical protein [Flavobacteriales bacterium]